MLHRYVTRRGAHLHKIAGGEGGGGGELDCGTDFPNSDIQLFQLRLSRRKGKRSNMSAKGLSGKSSFIPETLPFIGFPLSFKLDLAFL